MKPLIRQIFFYFYSKYSNCYPVLLIWSHGKEKINQLWLISLINLTKERKIYVDYLQTVQLLSRDNSCNFARSILHENYIPETLIRTDQNEDIKGYSIKLTFPTDSGNFRCRQDFNFRISDMQHFNFRCRLPLVFE